VFDPKKRANKKNKLGNQNQGKNKEKTKKHANKINKKKNKRTEENAGVVCFFSCYFFF
jgi:hypothetical protein